MIYTASFHLKSSLLSPQTPLQIPGSHSSLQTGSSSSFHSAVAGLPATEFAQLKIFPAWTQPIGQMLNSSGLAEEILGKQSFDDFNSGTDEGPKNLKKKGQCEFSKETGRMEGFNQGSCDKELENKDLMG